jgi:hypothetical protein
MRDADLEGVKPWSHGRDAPPPMLARVAYKQPRDRPVRYKLSSRGRELCP